MLRWEIIKKDQFHKLFLSLRDDAAAGLVKWMRIQIHMLPIGVSASPFVVLVLEISAPQ